MIINRGKLALEQQRIQEKGVSDAAQLASEERRPAAEIATENLHHGLSEHGETLRTRIKTASDERQNALSEQVPEPDPAPAPRDCPLV